MVGTSRASGKLHPFEKGQPQSAAETHETMPARDNLILLGVDSLWADHMSCYGYDRLTTPHIARFAGTGVLFERSYSPHIPTTSAYATMLTGMDCFGHETVALRHKGELTPRVKTLAEILKEQGYNTTCVGFAGKPSSRGFDTYLQFEAWGHRV